MDTQLVQNLTVIEATVQNQMTKFGRLDLESKHAENVLDQFQVLIDALNEIKKDYL
jgi:hypothetical protein